jgi:hypothetical protein
VERGRGVAFRGVHVQDRGAFAAISEIAFSDHENDAFEMIFADSCAKT